MCWARGCSAARRSAVPSEERLAPGGRLTLLCWQALADNPWVSVPRAAVLPLVQEPAAPPPDTPGPFRFADPAPLQRAGRLLAQSRPLPVLGPRAAAAQARGFAYFAAKVHPDVRLLDEGGTMLVDRIDAARLAGASALLCFALPRHPREVVEALAVAGALGAQF